MTFPRSNTLIAKGKVTTLPTIPRNKIQKIVLVLSTSTPVTAAREEAFINAKTNKTGENSKNGKNKDEDLGTSLSSVS